MRGFIKGLVILGILPLWVFVIRQVDYYRDSRVLAGIEKKAGAKEGRNTGREPGEEFRILHSRDAGLREYLRVVSAPTRLAKGEYHIDFPILIERGCLLEIAPGSILRFGRDAGIECKGVLLAAGTREAKILFAASGREWRNIALLGSGADDSILAHCCIRKGVGVEHTSFQGPGETRPGKPHCGGALFISRCRPSILYCTIEKNRADFGGGIYLEESEAFLLGNKISRNHARISGGGLYLLDTFPILEKNLLVENTAKERGGGISSSANLFHSVLNFFQARPRLHRNTFLGNRPN